MTREEVQEKLDIIVDARKLLYENNDFGGVDFGYNSYSGEMEQFVYSGIFELCEAMCIEPKRKFRQDSEYPIEVYFVYRGVRFFELYKTKKTVDINELELERKGNEKLPMDDVDEPQGVFKDIKETVDEFDKATTYTHKNSGVLGEV